MPTSMHHEILPEYPRTRHLPWKANAKRDDLIASMKEIEPIFSSPHVTVEEKIDGAACGMALYDDQPVIRNRNHIINKAFSRARTPAKLQFSSIWNWWYENKEKFEVLAEIAGPVSVYGDWMYMQHGMAYDRLPSLFMTYDLYDYEEHKYLSSHRSRPLLIEAGFSVVPVAFEGTVKRLEDLEDLAYDATPFATDKKREGVYLKVSDGRWIVHRFKMVRADFEQGCLLSKSEMKRNLVIEPSEE